MQLKPLFVLVVFMWVLVGCDKPATTQLERIKQKQTLKVGTLAGPANFYQAQQGEQGFEYELTQAFADSLNVKLKIVPFYSLPELFQRLDKGDLDFIAAGLSYHPLRAQQYRFGPSYRDISQKLVYKQGPRRPRSFAEIDAPITVLAGSNHLYSLQEAKQLHPHLEFQVVEDVDEEELLQSIIDEKITYTIADSHSLALFRRYHPEVSIAFSVTQQDSIGWVMRNEPDDSLYALLLPFFDKVNQSGKLAELEEKYFGHVETFNYVNTLAFVEAANSVLPKYQAWFKEYAAQNKLDWRLLAALSYQESMWKPRAKSPTGVRGIMMLTQPTAKQVGVKNRLKPEQNIRGGALYLSKLIKRVPKSVQYPDNIWFAMASYNVGWGHVNDARKITEQQGGDPDRWADVKKRLPLLIKKRYYRNTRYGYARGDVAVQYVDNIRRYYDALVWLDENGALNSENGQK